MATNQSGAGTVKFTSKWGFIISAVGSAVGMANVWGFPFRVGQNGGGAFLIAYLFFIILFSNVGLSTEYAVGRMAKTGTLGTYQKAWATAGKEKVGKAIGWLPLAGSMCIAVGYVIIIAYVLKALVSSVTGELMALDTAEWFASFSTTPYSVLPYHIIAVIGTILTLLLGAKSIERTNKIMMPLFFLIFIVLAIRVAFMPGALEGYRFIFAPDWQQLLNPMVWIWAMGQALFSLSITGSGMVVYGAYLENKEDVVHVARYTAALDTVAAMVAALVVIPACFSYGVDVASGPGLLFVTLPQILKDIPLGRLFSVILYLAMAFAGVSSLQNMFEAVCESLEYKFKIKNRKIALAIIAVICLAVGLGMEPIYNWGPWMDIISIYIIPIGAVLGAISWFWVMKKDALLEQINLGAATKKGNVWYWAGKFLFVPLVVILCLVALFMQISF